MFKFTHKHQFHLKWLMNEALCSSELDFTDLSETVRSCQVNLKKKILKITITQTSGSSLERVKALILAPCIIELTFLDSNGSYQTDSMIFLDCYCTNHKMTLDYSDNSAVFHELDFNYLECL